MKLSRRGVRTEVDSGTAFVRSPPVAPLRRSCWLGEFWDTMQKRRCDETFVNRPLRSAAAESAKQNNRFDCFNICSSFDELEKQALPIKTSSLNFPRPAGCGAYGSEFQGERTAAGTTSGS